MNRRNWISTVIGGACAAIWPWKAAEATELLYYPVTEPCDVPLEYWPPDDQPGTIKMWIPNETRPDPPDGWAYANGQDNAKSCGGTSTNWEDIVSRECISLPEMCRQDTQLEWRPEYVNVRFIERLDDSKRQGKVTITDGTQPDSLAD